MGSWFAQICPKGHLLDSFLDAANRGNLSLWGEPPPSGEKLMTMRYTRATWFRVSAAATTVAVGGLLAVTGTSLATPHASTSNAAKNAVAVSCALGNGVKHVVD